MLDPATATTLVVAIATLVTTVIGVLFAHLMLRRTPKLPEPLRTPVCTTIMGVPMREPRDLPGYSTGIVRVGISRAPVYRSLSQIAAEAA